MYSYLFCSGTNYSNRMLEVDSTAWSTKIEFHNSIFKIKHTYHILRPMPVVATLLLSLPSLDHPLIPLLCSQSLVGVKKGGFLWPPFGGFITLLLLLGPR